MIYTSDITDDLILSIHIILLFLIPGFGGEIDIAIIADCKQGNILFALVRHKETVLSFIGYKIYNSCFEASQCYNEWFVTQYMTYLNCLGAFLHFQPKPIYWPLLV